MSSTTSASLRTVWLSLTCGMVMASGESSVIRPRAAQLVVSGACSSSATRRSASKAFAWMMPLPAWIIGASAATSRSAARATCSAVGVTGSMWRYWCGAQKATSAFTLPFMMVSGTSTCTTPGRPS
jgi:hypothetical protein